MVCARLRERVNIRSKINYKSLRLWTQYRHPPLPKHTAVSSYRNYFMLIVYFCSHEREGLSLFSTRK